MNKYLLGISRVFTAGLWQDWFLSEGKVDEESNVSGNDDGCISPSYWGKFQLRQLEPAGGEVLRMEIPGWCRLSHHPKDKVRVCVWGGNNELQSVIDALAPARRAWRESKRTAKT